MQGLWHQTNDMESHGPPPAGETQPGASTMGYCTNKVDVEEAAHALYSTPPSAGVGVDLETTGVDPFLDSPLLLGIGPHIIPMNKKGLDLRPIYAIIENRDILKVFHNLVFDTQFFLKLGVFPAGCICTMLGARLLRVGINQPRGTFGLGNLLKKCLGVHHDKSLQTSFVGMDPSTFRSSQEQRDYLYRDVASLPALAQYLGNHLKRRGLMETWQLENAYAPVLAMMQIHGVPLDVGGYIPELEKAEEDFIRLEQGISTYLTPHIMEVRRRRFEEDRETHDTWSSGYASVKEQNHDIVYGAGVTTGTKQLLASYNELNREWKLDNKEPRKAVANPSPILVTSSAQIKAALGEMGIVLESTDKDTLYIARAGRTPEEQDVLKLLGDLSEVKKVRSNEGREMLARLRPLPGLPTWGVLTTRFNQLQSTGRLSSSQFKDNSRCRVCGVQNPVITESEDDEYDEDAEEDTNTNVVAKPPCVGCGVVLKARKWGSNVQNLTVRVKQHCHPRPGERFIVADYGQIELRVAAEVVLRRDPAANDAVVRAFRDGIDPHRDMAAAIKGMSYADFTAWLATGDPEAASVRFAGKTTNFSATFFIGPAKLAVGIYIARHDTGLFGRANVKEAGKLLDLYWSRNPTLKRILDDYGREALETGSVATLGGRRRYFDLPPNMSNGLRGHIRRQAANTPIQGTAADIVKTAQASLYRIISENDREAYLWAAVHDEVDHACKEDTADLWKGIVRQEMERAFYKYIKHVKCELTCEEQTAWQH